VCIDLTKSRILQKVLSIFCVCNLAFLSLVASMIFFFDLFKGFSTSSTHLCVVDVCYPIKIRYLAYFKR
jgi:hypothetical protein